MSLEDSTHEAALIRHWQAFKSDLLQDHLLCQTLIPHTVSQHAAATESYLRVIIPDTKHKQESATHSAVKEYHEQQNLPLEEHV